MNILVLGSGGREHALAWKLRGSSRCEKIFIYPGNAGTRRDGFATWESADLDSPQRLISRAEQEGISLVVVGPEALLAEGYADTFRQAGFLVVGPNRDSARLETSKIFAKKFMSAAGIPTAPFWIAESSKELLEKTSQGPWPIVLKLDGLAAGKGVVIAKSVSDVKDFSQRIWSEGEFGADPHAVLGEVLSKETSSVTWACATVSLSYLSPPPPISSGWAMETAAPILAAWDAYRPHLSFRKRSKKKFRAAS